MNAQPIENLAKPCVRVCTGILPVFHGRDAHATGGLQSLNPYENIHPPALLPFATLADAPKPHRATAATD